MIARNEVKAELMVVNFYKVHLLYMKLSRRLPEARLRRLQWRKAAQTRRTKHHADRAREKWSAVPGGG